MPSDTRTKAQLQKALSEAEAARTEAEKALDRTTKRLGSIESTAYNRDLEIRRLRREVANVVTAKEGVERRLATIETIQARNLGVADWVARPLPGKGEHRGTPVLMLSDLHLDERVSVAEMDGLNSYNREIAEQRLERVIESTIEMMHTYVAGLTLDGIVVALNGDIITGDIHEELMKTNQAPVPATIVHWLPILAGALTRLADAFGRVQVFCTDGNHDRTTKKIQKKKRAETSNAWIVYNVLAMLLEDDERITIEVSKAPEIVFDIYDTTFLQTHGDAFKGGGGVGGIWPPMMRWLKSKQNVRKFDIALIGHWHQLIYGQGIFVNGSLKGYDEYAMSLGFGFERPQQMLFVVTPENGVTHRLNVFADSKRELTLWS